MLKIDAIVMLALQSVGENFFGVVVEGGSLQLPRLWSWEERCPDGSGLQRDGMLCLLWPRWL
jgi:hypothetical protein